MGCRSLTSRHDVQCFSRLLHFWLAASDLVALVWVVIIDLCLGVWKSFVFLPFHLPRYEISSTRRMTFVNVNIYVGE